MKRHAGKRALTEVSALALTALLATANAALPAHASEIHRFDIAATDATSAIHDFASQSGVQILAAADAVHGKRFNSVAGLHSTEEGLRILLAGTGLTHQYMGERAVALLGEAPRVTPATRADSSQTSESKDAKGGEKQSFWTRFRLAQVDQGTTTNSGTVERSGSSAEGRPTHVEEVVVTAQKRTERLLEAPQSVSVLSGDELTKLGATQFRDFANSVPGLSFQTAGPGWTQISLRGVTAGFDVSPTVGIYVDEVPYGSNTSAARGGQLALDVAPYDLQHIEVLRGPQGTLYGASTMGGLIKYVMRRPDPGDFSAFGTAGLSTTENGGTNYNVVTGVNAPLVTDKLALRATAFQTYDDGYVDNVALGRNDVNSSDTRGGRLDVLFAPSTNLSVRIGGFLQDTSTDGFPLSERTLAGASVNGDLAQARPQPEGFDQRFKLVAGTVSYDFGPAELVSISSYQTAEARFKIDLSPVFLAFAQSLSAGVPLSAVGSLIETDTDKFTQEIRLVSTGESTLEWIIGGYYTDEDSEDRSNFITLDQSGQRTPNNILVNSNPSAQKEYAAFGDLTWRLTDRFDVTGGVRYARMEAMFAQAQSGVLAVPAQVTEASDDVFTYLANARYRFSDRATAYARYATGYRPTGPNFVVIDPATGLPIGDPIFDPDRLESYEIGFKAETAERRFGIDAGVYYIDWSNLQVTVSRSGFVIRQNVADGATSRGADLTLTARPSDAFTVTGNMAFMDAYMNEATTALRAGKGERSPNVPRFTTAWNADYRFGADGLQPTIGATIRHVGERTLSYDASTSPPQYRLPSYTTADLRLGLQLGSVSTQLYVHNLSDERAEIPPRLSGVTPAAGPYSAGISQPRTIGVSLSMTF